MSTNPCTPSVCLQTAINRQSLLELLATHPQPHEAAAHLSNEIAATSNKTLDHTLDHIDCPACQAADELLNVDPDEMREMTFPDAAALWAKRRSHDPNLKPRALESIKSSLAALEKFFGRIKMKSITAGMLLSYQQARKTNTFSVGGTIQQPWRKPSGNSTINHDLNVLSQMLDFCKLWVKIAPEYYPLPIRGWSPRQKNFTEQEEEEFFAKLAASDDEMVQTAFWVALATTNTTASGIELRGLRLNNVMLEEIGKTSTIYIPEDSCKNDTRPRRIPLNDTARFALANLLMRANRLGSKEPDHFLFPFYVVRGRYDPTRRAARGFFRKSWDKLREVTGFADVTPHLLRHLSITKLLERGVPGERIRQLSGQLSPKMIDYYAHVRLNASAADVAQIDQSKVIPFTSRKRRAK